MFANSLRQSFSFLLLLPMPYTDDLEFEAFIHQLPKTETHLHMEGACPFELLQAMDPKKYANPPAFWGDDFRYESFDQFMEWYAEYCSTFFTSAQRYHDGMKIVLGNCAAQGCRYVETSFHLPVLLGIEDSGPTLLDAVRSAAPEGLELRIFAGMCHDDYRDEGIDLIEESLTWDGLDGLDLHGPEYLPLEPWTADVWGRARQAGKFTKAHAGEFMGADFIDVVLDKLKVTRIEHGVRAIENPVTVQRLVDEKIALDVCPISNLKLAVKGVASMSAHPIRQLYDSGVIVTINSDDPFFFGNRLSEEYFALKQDLGFSKKELAQVACNGFQIALIDETQRNAYESELNDYLTDFELN
ncbi:MAG: adenosine deaminase [Opitutaceae bacterium]|nr:adenosine deaminase [Opitutaceae bacterium]